MQLAGTLLDDAGAWSSLSTLQILIMAGELLHGLPNSACALMISGTCALMISGTWSMLLMGHSFVCTQSCGENVSCTCQMSVQSTMFHIVCTLLTICCPAVNNLQGQLPASLASLTRLSHLDLTDNLFTSNVPSVWFSNMISLENLQLSGNDLNGTLPAMANLTKLVQLQLNDNPWLTGSIPQA